jgi:hypothetical protein
MLAGGEAREASDDHGGRARVVPDHTNQGTNHWTIDAIGTLQSASDTVGKKLVLSDSTCDEKKDAEKK